MSKLTVLKSNVVAAPAGKNYKICELAYKTDEGKTKGMKIFDFKYPEVFKVASAAKVGDVLDAQFKQSDKGFWEFATLQATGERDVVQSTTTNTHNAGSTKGNWETTEERADRQAKISKQAVLNTAVAFFEAAKVKPSKEDVVEVAKHFLEFVNDKVVQTGEVQ